MFVQRHIFCALSLGVAITTVSSFETEPFAPPVFNVTELSGLPLASGLVFLTPLNLTAGSAVIMTGSGDLVWSSEASGSYTNFLTTSLYGQPVLTFWNGTGNANPLISGHGYGKVQILDNTYTELYSICPDLNLNFPPAAIRYECQADIHESVVTDRGTLIVTAYNYTQADLTSINGTADGWIYDGLVFEIDIPTQEILFSWSAIEHVPVNATKLPLAGAGSSADPFDYFHINSIQPVGDGFLVNSRHTWTTYKIDSKGQIEWEFEGSNGGDFELPSDGEFSWQHRVRVEHVTPEGLVLHMFDNANANRITPNQTLGLDFYLNLTSKEATILKRLADPNEPLFATSQGAYDALPNGNVFMGYGELPVFKEFGPEGDVRMSTQWAGLDASSSYRTYRLDWTAQPAASPIVVARAGSAFMSWNGATNIAGWEIYEGETADALNLTKTVANDGFETKVSISNSTQFVQVAALWGHYHGSARNSSVVSVS
ncbi:uncharacterized protein LY89DRAFT_750346 [Mollisia scopiformis]|uniref:ASST-domain-containing protein n=1 Tax=Mollisia scopiformis TaxID=149040 RepID=A0A194X4K9_MOLSC|nr:uncharacterized protein LY89DRAFT_750346 [Mollisia scopiformis]KUJ15115.1 hypothetical protein LY89DRAFT_750346 [Mollisia scopiformis]